MVEPGSDQIVRRFSPRNTLWYDDPSTPGDLDLPITQLRCFHMSGNSLITTSCLGIYLHHIPELETAGDGSDSTLDPIWYWQRGGGFRSAAEPPTGRHPRTCTLTSRKAEHMHTRVLCGRIEPFSADLKSQSHRGAARLLRAGPPKVAGSEEDGD